MLGRKGIEFRAALGVGSLTTKKIVDQATGSNIVDFNNYVIFWQSIQNIQLAATKFIIEIITKIIEVDKNTQKQGASKTTGKDPELIISSLLHTINFLDLFYPIQANFPAFVKTIRQYEQHRKENPKSSIAALIEVDLAMKHLDKKWIQGSDTTTQLVIECAYINGSSMYALMMSARAGGGVSSGGKGPSRMLAAQAFTVLRDSPFPYIRLIANVNSSGSSAQQIMDVVLKQLTSMLPLIRAQPSVSRAQVGNTLALMHILGECMTLFPVVDVTYLSHALDVIGQFNKWPRPYCLVAAKLTRLIKAEIQCPGANARSRIQKENPLLTMFGNEQADKYGFRAVEWSRMQRNIVVTIDPEVPLTDVYRRSLESVLPKGNNFNLEMNKVKHDLLVGFLETTLTNTSVSNSMVWRSNILESLKKLSADMLDECFTDMLKSTSLLSSDQSLQESQVLALAKKISPTLVAGASFRQRVRKTKKNATNASIVHAAAAAAAVRSQIRKQGSTLDSISDEEGMIQRPSITGSVTGGSSRQVADSLESIPETFNSVDQELWLHSAPVQPNLTFDFQETGCFSTSRGGNTGSRTAATTDVLSALPDWANETSIASGLFQIPGRHHGPRRYIEYAVDFQQLLNDAQSIIPPELTEGEEDEKDKVRENQAKCVLKRVVMGSNAVLHRFVCCYVALRHLHPELCDNIDFNVYVCPIGKSDVTAFIAQHDGWYRKNVYIPFHAPLIMCPQVKSVQNRGNDEMTFATSDTGASASTPAIGSPQHTSNLTSRFSNLKDNSSSASNTNNSNDTSGYVLDAVPTRFLRYVLQDYVRSAHFALPIRIFDCECWGDQEAIEFPASALGKPDQTIPFVTRAELGLGAAIAQYSNRPEFRGNFMGEAASNGQGTFPTIQEIVNDKEFVKIFSPTVELNVSIYPMTVDGKFSAAESDKIELRESSYVSLVVANVSSYTIPTASANNIVRVSPHVPTSSFANPKQPWLELISISTPNSSIPDIIKKQVKKQKDLDALIEAHRTESNIQYAGLIDIKCSPTNRVPFVISLDDVAYGPFYRVRIQPCQALVDLSALEEDEKENDPPNDTIPTCTTGPFLTLPVMTFLPCFDSE